MKYDGVVGWIETVSYFSIYFAKFHVILQYLYVIGYLSIISRAKNNDPFNLKNNFCRFEKRK